MANKVSVFLITRTDHEDPEDIQGRMQPVSIHSTKALANAAAEAYLISESEDTCGAEDPEIYHEGGGNEFYTGSCVCYEDERHEFRVAVEEMELEGAEELEGVFSAMAEKTAKKKSSGKARRENNDDGGEPVKKKTRRS